MIIQVAVTQKIFLEKLKKTINFIIIKQAYQLNQRSYGFEILSRHYPFIKSLMFKGLLNQNKVDWMVSKHLSSCKFKNFSVNQFWYLVMPTG